MAGGGGSRLRNNVPTSGGGRRVRQGKQRGPGEKKENTTKRPNHHRPGTRSRKENERVGSEKTTKRKMKDR